MEEKKELNAKRTWPQEHPVKFAILMALLGAIITQIANFIFKK